MASARGPGAPDPCSQRAARAAADQWRGPTSAGRGPPSRPRATARIPRVSGQRDPLGGDGGRRSEALRRGLRCDRNQVEPAGGGPRQPASPTIPAMTSLGYALSSEEHAARDLVAHAAARGAARLRVRAHLRPLPPVDRPPGSESVRLERPRRDRQRDGPARRRHRASRARRCGSIRRSSPRPPRPPRRCCPSGSFSASGRANDSTSTSSATHWPDWDDPRRDARGGRRRHPRALDRRDDEPSRPALHGRERPDLLAARVAAADPRRRQRPRAWRPSPVGSATGSSAPVPRRTLIDAYRNGGGNGPRFGQVTVCWADDRAEGARGRPGSGGRRRRSTATCRRSSRCRRTSRISRGSWTRTTWLPRSRAARSAQPILDAIDAYVDAGYDHVYLHQVGPDQEGFLEFAARSLLPEFDREPASRGLLTLPTAQTARAGALPFLRREVSPRTQPGTSGRR